MQQLDRHHYVWFQGQCKGPDALLGTSVKHLHLQDSRFKTLSSRLPKLNSPEDLIRELEATPNRYTVPLFDQFDEKTLNHFIPEYIVPETNSSQIRNI
jgi:hypothetical protein